MPNATYSKKINRAFVIEPEDLRYFYGEGKRFMEANASGSFKTQIIGGVKNLDTILIREEPDSIIGYSNPRQNEITAIAIFMKSEDQQHSFELTFENTPFEPPTHLSVGGKSLEEVDPCSRRLEAELLERAQWYSFISNRVGLVKYRWVLLALCAFFVVLGLTSTFARLNQLKLARGEVQRALSQHDIVADANELKGREKLENALKSIDTAASPVNLIKWVLVFIAAFFVGKTIERAIHYLFPRVVFEIGAGKKRHETIKRIRKHAGYWIMTLIVGLLLLVLSWKLRVK